MLAIAVVGLVTWKVFRVILGAKPVNCVPEVGFGSQWVLAPRKLMVNVWPGIPDDGDSDQINGVGGGGGVCTRKFPVRPWVPVCTTTVRYPGWALPATLISAVM